MTFHRALSLVAMAFLWTGSQIPVYLLGGVPPYVSRKPLPTPGYVECYAPGFRHIVLDANTHTRSIPILEVSPTGFGLSWPTSWLSLPSVLLSARFPT